MFKIIAKIFGLCTGIVALALMLVYLFTIVNTQFHWVTTGVFLEIMQFLRLYGTIALVFLASGAFMLKRFLALKIIWLLLLIAVVVLFIIYPIPIV